mgnify:CR=1 FL=1
MGKLRFEPLISVGSLIQMGVLVVSFIGLYHKMDTTIAVHTQKFSEQDRRITSLEEILIKHYGTPQRN